jgi:hypothetical protein
MKPPAVRVVVLKLPRDVPPFPFPVSDFVIEPILLVANVGECPKGHGSGSRMDLYAHHEAAGRSWRQPSRS